MEKISFVCTTYRRFTCVQRIVNQYYAQSYGNKELIIYNTDEEYPYTLGFYDPNIIVVNNGINIRVFKFKFNFLRLVIIVMINPKCIFKKLAGIKIFIHIIRLFRNLY